MKKLLKLWPWASTELEGPGPTQVKPYTCPRDRWKAQACGDAERSRVCGLESLGGRTPE